MDPIEQILAQQHSGSADGQGFGQFYAQGVQQRQNQENINLANQRLALERQSQDTLLPLQANMLRQNIANVGIEAKTRELQLQSMVEQNSAMPELLNLEMQFAQHPEGYNQAVLTEQLRGLQARYPHAFTAGPGLEMRNNLKAQAMFDMEAANVNKIRRQAQSINDGLEVDKMTVDSHGVSATFKQHEPLSVPGKIAEDVSRATAQGDYETAEFIKAHADKLTQERLGKLQSERDIARVNGDTEKLTELNAAIKQEVDHLYAPSEFEKNLSLLDKLKDSPDALAAVKKKLGIGELNQMQLAAFKAELKSVDTNPNLAGDPDAQAKARAAISRKYQSTSSGAPVKDTSVQAQRERIRADHNAGKLSREAALKALEATGLK